MARYGQTGIEAERRRARLAELLRSGMRTGDAISACADEFGVHYTTAWRDSQVLRAEAAKRCAIDADTVTQRQLADLTSAREVALQQIAADPEKAYRFIPGLVSLLDREARLLGLDKPEKHEVSHDLQVIVPGLEQADGG